VDSVGPGWGQAMGSCIRGDEPSGSGATETDSYISEDFA
jgi:hypothetical protein